MSESEVELKETAEAEDNVQVVQIEDVPKVEVAVGAVEVTTTKDRIDAYFDEKILVIADKIGDTINQFDPDAGSFIKAYFMSSDMLRSVVALMCYEASGGKGNDADNVAAIIEIVCGANASKYDIFSHDYLADLNNGVKSVIDLPGAVLRGDVGFLGSIFDAIRGSPRVVADSIDVAKAAVGDTIAEVWRGNFVEDSAYISGVKTGYALSMAIACRVGSEKAMNEECISLCNIYGRNLGVAYTVMRDIVALRESVKTNECNEELVLAMLYGLDKCGANAIIGTADAQYAFKEMTNGDNFDDVVARLGLVVSKYKKNAIKAAERLPTGLHRDMLVELPNYLEMTL